MNKYKIIFESKLAFKDKIDKCAEVALHEIQKNNNSNVKLFFTGQTIWTEVNCDYKDKESGWYNHTLYYYGNLTELSKEDWRISEVKNNRKNVKYNKLILIKENHGLKQNHVKDYNSYLQKYL